MNIGVITPYDSANFGAYLQAYCLKRSLETMGHCVYHLKTRDEEYVKNLYYTEKPKSKRDKFFFFCFKKKRKFGKEKYHVFQEAQKVFQPCDDTKSIEAYIIGSDEIWNIRKKVFQKEIFWGKGLKNAIAYAPSIGNASVGMFASQPQYGNAVEHLRAVMVRDQNTQLFVERYCTIPAEIVCDPTMLVPIEDYGEAYVDEFISNHECILIYAYKLDAMSIKKIKQFAKKNKLKTVACCFYHNWCDHQCNCSPLQFSSLIRQSKYVFTTTFHGTIFSVLNHANFVCMPNSPKSIQLCQQLHLSERMIKDPELMESALEKKYECAIDYAATDRIIVDLREHSQQLLKHVLDCIERDPNGTKNVILKQETKRQQERCDRASICPPEECVSCFACVNSCAFSAIRKVQLDDGRILPYINESNCRGCNACRKVCPQLNPPEFHAVRDCYAAQWKNEEERIQSSSAGIGMLLMKYTIQQGGCVFGAVIDHDLMIRHVCAESLEEAKRMRTSKYATSDIGSIYRQVKQKLTEGNRVLFTGTPCQVAGLRKYIGSDNQLLTCVDLVCHGTPPMAYFKQHINQKYPNATGCFFRGGNQDKVLRIIKDDIVQNQKPWWKDEYYFAFNLKLIQSENCYNCHYARQERVGDITIGDFWKIDRKTLSTPMSGRISLVLVNTEQGEKIWREINEEVVWEKRTMQEAVKGNTNLLQPSIPRTEWSSFIEQYKKNANFDQAFYKSTINAAFRAYKLKKSLLGRVLKKTIHIFK